MEQPIHADSWVTPRELANAVGVTKPTVINWIKRGWVAYSVLPNGRRIIPGSELRRLTACAGGDNSSVLLKDKGPEPTNGNEANERIPGERLELSPYENSTSPATPSATAEERA